MSLDLLNEFLPLFDEQHFAVGTYDDDKHRWEYRRRGLRLAEADLSAHVSATVVSGQRVGAYLMEDESETTLVVVLDFDNKPTKEHFDQQDFDLVMYRVLRELDRNGFRYLLLRSSSGAGYHVYLKWEMPQIAAHVRAHMISTLVDCGLKEGTAGTANGEVEIFPKSDDTMSRTSALICLPFCGDSAVVNPFDFSIVDAADTIADWKCNDPVPPLAMPSASTRPLSTVPPQMDLVRAALKYVPADCGYDEWVQVGMALFNSYGSDAEPLWLEWSESGGTAYDEKSARDKWDDIRKKARGQNSAASILHHAKENGWQPVQPFALNSFGNAQRFLAYFGDRFRYVVPMKQWIFWNGERWRFSNNIDAEQHAKLVTQMMVAEGEALGDGQLRAYGARIQEPAPVENMLKMARSETGVFVQPEQLDRNDLLIQLGNGVYDLKNRCFKEPNSDDLITMKSPVLYDPAATCPRWVQFLDEVTDGDNELVNYIWRAVGYTLSGMTIEQCFFFLYGGGSNGKSLFINVIRYLMGDYAVGINSDSLMSSRANTIPNDIARMRGTRLVVGSEIGEEKEWNSAVVKDATGEDTLTARFLYQEFFDFAPTHKIWMYGNEKPKIKSRGHAIWRRVKLIPFIVQFADDDQDKMLRYTLLNEISGILNWAIEGFHSWRIAGLGECAAVVEATSQYRTDEESVNVFCRECLVFDGQNEDKLRLSVLYGSYRQWCRKNKYPHVGNTTFGRRLENRGAMRHKDASVYFTGVYQVPDDDYDGPDF